MCDCAINCWVCVKKMRTRPLVFQLQTLTSDTTATWHCAVVVVNCTADIDDCGLRAETETEKVDDCRHRTRIEIETLKKRPRREFATTSGGMNRIVFLFLINMHQIYISITTAS